MPPAQAPVYFEDIEIGLVREIGPTTLSAQEIITFARQFDPEPFHIDPEAAKRSHFGELVASGAHTFALWRRLCFESQREHRWQVLAGAGFDQMRLLAPVKPGDALRVRAELIEKIPSRTKPDRGVIRTRETVLNQDDRAVMTMIGTAIMARRPGS